MGSFSRGDRGNGPVVHDEGPRRPRTEGPGSAVGGKQLTRASRPLLRLELGMVRPLHVLFLPPEP